MKNTYYSTISVKGQVTIPAPLRELLGLNKGTRVVFELLDDRVVVKRAKNLEDLAGIFDTGRRLTLEKLKRVREEGEMFKKK